MRAGFANPLARGQRPGYPAAIDRIKEKTRELLQLPEDAAVSVTELACRDPNCPDVQTVVAVLSAGHKPRTARFHKSIPELGNAELEAGLRKIEF